MSDVGTGRVAIVIEGYSGLAAGMSGGLIKGMVDKANARRAHNDGQKARVENAAVLIASGLIAGEALVGLLIAAWRRRR